MAQRYSRPVALGGVGLIVLCFIGSAALRLTENGMALADEIGAFADGTPGEAPGGDAVTCPAATTAEAETLLAAIRERGGQIAVEEARLADRAQTLAVAEARLAEHLAAFERARASLEETLAVADQAAERDIERMTVIYENMKPAEAAKIFERMDVTFAAGLLARMRPELAAQVLTGMSADSAYALTLTVASRNSRVPTE